ncbi:MAG: hypothetical protein ACRDZO_05620 [Egibacteraceae bacterium]
MRDAQIAARHADPRATTRYDRARHNLDRHASYIVIAFLAGTRLTVASPRSRVGPTVIVFPPAASAPQREPVSGTAWRVFAR